MVDDRREIRRSPELDVAEGVGVSAENPVYSVALGIRRMAVEEKLVGNAAIRKLPAETQRGEKLKEGRDGLIRKERRR